MHQQAVSTAFAPTRRETSGVSIAGIQRAGMLDWPGRVTATVFLGGCNLRCPFCHNPELVGSPRRAESTDTLFALIRERRAWLDGIVITGGEPCIDAGLPELVLRLKSEGMPVKLDTNGTRPDVLARLLEGGLLDYVALDVKATADKYPRATGRSDIWPDVEKSIAHVISSGVDHEFRTTCYPLAVGPNDPVAIAAQLRGGRRYVLQQYRPTRTLDPAAISVRPHTADTLCKASERCASYLPTTVRGVSG